MASPRLDFTWHLMTRPASGPLPRAMWLREFAILKRSRFGKRQQNNTPAALSYATMKMHVSPTAVMPLPDASFLRASSHGIAARVELLHEANEADYRHIAHYADVRRADRDVHRPRGAAQLEVEVMELHPFDPLPAGFRLKTSEARVAKFFVRGPI